MPGPVRLLGAVRVTARYRAPAGDGALLAQPPLAEIGGLLDANAERLKRSGVRLAGMPLAEFRRRVIAEVIAAAGRYLGEAESRGREPSGTSQTPSGALPSVGGPADGGSQSGPPRLGGPTAHALLVAGHQPEFFHPGVWVKNFVLAGQAARHGRTALNLVVDNDTVKSTAIRVPVRSDDPREVRAEAIPFDHPDGDRPYEEYHVTDRGVFDSFPDRLSAVTRTWGFEPLAGATWPTLQAELDGGAVLGEAVSRARRLWERRWGVSNLELPVSRLAGTRAFAGFVQTILADLPRFADCYNAAIRAYRQANRLRSRNHPAPDLVRRGDGIEAPFWAWRSDAPRRARLFARRTEQGIQLRAGERPVGRVPADANGFAAAWADLAAAGWKVRPRALTLTLFTRLGLADGFIHGIGGGKYDEVTDDLVRRFFGIEPPGYAVVSATVRLPIDRFPATAELLHRAQRQARDLEWNPQAFPDTAERFPDRVFEKARLIATEPAGHADRRHWFRQLQQVTREMRPAVADRLQAERDRRDRLRVELDRNTILTSREYAWPLFPESLLRNFLTQFE